MQWTVVRVAFAATLLVGAAPASTEAQTLNLSHDLVTLGIAGQNLAPDVPALDGRPLIQAGIDYAAGHHYATVTADPGAYYLLTTGLNQYYVHLYGVSNLTVDFAGATLYLQKGFAGGFILGDCQHVTLTNFTIDYLQLPYTHVQLTSVDTAGRRLLYTTLPGWTDPATFTGMTPYGPSEFVTLAFRNGTIVPGTGRTPLVGPITAGVLQLTADGMPWTQGPTLATLHPGDTIVVMERGGEPPVKSVNGDGITFSYITLLASSTWAVQSDHDRNSLIDHVTVKPRPGLFIGSNADGIHFAWSRQNNHIRNCVVTGTVDDAFAIDALQMAQVVAWIDARHVRVKRVFYEPFPTGSAINFVDPATSREISAGHLVAQNPSDATVPVFNGTVDLTFDQDVPPLVPGSPMVFGSTDMRAGGSSIEDSTVGIVWFGRGIWLSGVEHVTVARNTVGHTSNAGIIVWGHTHDQQDAGPPSHDVIIEDNTVTGSAGPMATGTGTQTAFGSIMVSSTDSNFGQSPVAVNSNITIRRNTIAEAGRAGIWIGQVDGGVVQDNHILSWNQHPELPLWGLPANDQARIPPDFLQPMVIRFSAGLTGGVTPLSQYLAEGATGSFFDTRLAFFNPDGSAIAIVNLTFQTQDRVNIGYSLALPPHARQTLDVKTVPGLASASFSTRIDASVRIVVDRTMSWDHSGYGSHAETALAGPATTWYLAEGSTSGDFSLFYLFQNPNATAVTATVRYLRAFGLAPIQKVYQLPPLSRTTIQVDGEGPGLDSADLSGVVTATAPIIVERAMYRSSPAQTFAAGHESAGVTAPATHWFLAEGATGPFFDMFILLANPTDDMATVDVRYLLSTGTAVTKTYTVPANRRVTIPVDTEEIPAGSGQHPLLNVAVSTDVTSTNGVPIIVERTMWWPSPEVTPNFWSEAHNSPGTTETGTKWALAEGETGGPVGTETFVLIANTSGFGGQARVTFYAEDGTTAERIVSLLATSRTTINMSADVPELRGKRYGVIVEALGATPPALVVERAMYSSPGGVTWAAGTNSVGTRLP